MVHPSTVDNFSRYIQIRTRMVIDDENPKFFFESEHLRKICCDRAMKETAISSRIFPKANAMRSRF